MVHLLSYVIQHRLQAKGQIDLNIFAYINARFYMDRLSEYSAHPGFCGSLGKTARHH